MAATIIKPDCRAHHLTKQGRTLKHRGKVLAAYGAGVKAVFPGPKNPTHSRHQTLDFNSGYLYWFALGIEHRSFETFSVGHPNLLSKISVFSCP
jgi:hypothetical protein